MYWTDSKGGYLSFLQTSSERGRASHQNYVSQRDCSVFSANWRTLLFHAPQVLCDESCGLLANWHCSVQGDDAYRWLQLESRSGCCWLGQVSQVASLFQQMPRAAGSSIERQHCIIANLFHGIRTQFSSHISDWKKRNRATASIIHIRSFWYRCSFKFWSTSTQDRSC